MVLCPALESNLLHKHAKWSPSDLTPCTLTLAWILCKIEIFVKIEDVKKRSPTPKKFLAPLCIGQAQQMTRNGINSIKAANKRIMSQRQSDIVKLLLIGTPVDQSLVNDDDGQKFRQFVMVSIEIGR